MKINKRGSVSLYLTFLITAIIIITITAALAPMGVRFNTEIYAAAEGIMLDSNSTISQISDSDVKAEIQSAIEHGLSASQDNIEVNAGIFQYSWVFMLILSFLVVFLYTRRLTEVQGLT